jgi:acetyltransferase-like isoleucine patch superfamily enzyme
VTIGERGYVAANAVVTKDVEPWTLVAGNPAKPIKTWNGSAWVSAREGTD